MPPTSTERWRIRADRWSWSDRSKPVKPDGSRPAAPRQRPSCAPDPSGEILCLGISRPPVGHRRSSRRRSGGHRKATSPIAGGWPCRSSAVPGLLRHRPPASGAIGHAQDATSFGIVAHCWWNYLERPRTLARPGGSYPAPWNRSIDLPESPEASLFLCWLRPPRARVDGRRRSVGTSSGSRFR